MLPVNYCSGFTSLKLYGHVKFSISIIMYALYRDALFSDVTVFIVRILYYFNYYYNETIYEQISACFKI